MKYMGSKSRFRKQIISCIGDVDGLYIEPFAGGMNMIQDVRGGRRVANDSNKYVIAMFRMALRGWVPGDVSRDEYNSLKLMKGEDHEIGWAGVGCSYSGKWFGGYAGLCNTKGGVRDYQDESRRSLISQVEKLRDVEFSSVDYRDLVIPDGSVVYCDPPYRGTTGYGGGFDSDEFWSWVRMISPKCRVFVSEYSAPDDFDCIWKAEASSSLSANGLFGGSKKSTERLFVMK